MKNEHDNFTLATIEAHKQRSEEWTPEYVANLIENCCWPSKKVADTHNAALAAEHQAGWLEGRQYEVEFGVKPHRSEQEWDRTTIAHLISGAATHIEEWQRIVDAHNAALAAEREKRKPLVDALKFFKSVIQSGESWTATCQKAYDDALAEVKKENGESRQ